MIAARKHLYSGLLIVLTLGACSGNNTSPPSGQTTQSDGVGAEDGGSTIWDLFGNRDDPNVTVQVNKYLWVASQDVLDFLPIRASDPFTGTISTGYGVPRGGSRAYRATIRISDPALDARSLNLSLQDRNGRPVSRETQRAVEDAILTRARQLRIQDLGL